MAKLTPRQLDALQLIAAGQSQRQAAKAVGVSPQTMTAWRHLPEFENQLEALMAQAQAETLTMLRGQRIKALETINHLMDSAPAATRLQAARTVLEASATLPPLPPVQTHPAPHDELRDALIKSQAILQELGIFKEENHAPNSF